MKCKETFEDVKDLRENGTVCCHFAATSLVRSHLARAAAHYLNSLLS